LPASWVIVLLASSLLFGAPPNISGPAGTDKLAALRAATGANGPAGPVAELIDREKHPGFLRVSRPCEQKKAELLKTVCPEGMVVAGRLDQDADGIGSAEGFSAQAWLGRDKAAQNSPGAAASGTVAGIVRSRRPRLEFAK